MLKNYLFVESPFQLLSAYEATNYYNLEFEVYLVRYNSDANNNHQIKELIDRFGIKNKVESVHINSRKRTLLDYAKILHLKCRFFLHKSRIKKCFVGNYESNFFRFILNLHADNIILLDDGAKTYTIQSRFSSNFYINFFTCFDIERYTGQIIDCNNFLKLKEDMSGQGREDKVIFLGSKLSEAGVISRERYMILMHEISTYYKDKKIIYIPHRGEKSTEVNSIVKANSNIELEVCNYPVELYGVINKKTPLEVASFYSTALYTMNKIYACKVTAFKFDYSNSCYSEAIDVVYKSYSKTINIVDLNA